MPCQLLQVEAIAATPVEYGLTWVYEIKLKNFSYICLVSEVMLDDCSASGMVIKERLDIVLHSLVDYFFTHTW
jgi:hypothetical protein